MKSFLCLIIIFHSALCAANTTINPKAPAETSQYAPLLGKWSIKDSYLDKEGQWVDGKGADWNWYTILDGHAIQDDWIAPSLSVEVEDGKRGYGTNIRIYNPKKSQWQQIWVSNAGRKFDTFSAVEKNGSIVMRGFYGGNETRITFYNLQTNSFDWKLENQDKDNPEIWKEVYRIHGTRKK